MIRYTASPVGRVPTQIDYADYRDVNGIKFPFDYQFLWLDGRFNAKLKNVQINTAIDAATAARRLGDFLFNCGLHEPTSAIGKAVAADAVASSAAPICATT